MTEQDSNNLQAHMLFNQFKQSLDELGITYNATLIAGLDTAQPINYHASSDPFIDHRMVSVSKLPNDAIRVVECSNRALSNTPPNGSLWTRQCSAHYLENLKYNFQATILVQGFEQLTTLLRGV